MLIEEMVLTERERREMHHRTWGGGVCLHPCGTSDPHPLWVSLKKDRVRVPLRTPLVLAVGLGSLSQ